MDNVIVLALFWGLISAISLPLGTLTLKFYQPSDTVLAFLLAFGGGALFAALSIDLAAVTVERGHFFEMTVGGIIGGILYYALSNIANEQGGFLRKVPFFLRFLKKREAKRLIQLSNHFQGVPIISELSDYELTLLLKKSATQSYKKHEIIYRSNDPSKFLYFIEYGKIRLINPNQNKKEKKVSKGAFSTTSFFTRTPHVKRAVVASSEAMIRKISFKSFYKVIKQNESAKEQYLEYLKSEKARQTILSFNQNSELKYQNWINKVTSYLTTDNTSVLKISVKRNKANLKKMFQLTTRFNNFFTELSERDIKALSKKAVYKVVEKDTTLFSNGDLADRFYIIDEGEIEVIRSSAKQKPLFYSNQSVIGLRSILTKSNRTRTAITLTRVKIWVIYKKDFYKLISRSYNLRLSLIKFIHNNLQNYLYKDLALSTEESEKWKKKAEKELLKFKTIKSSALHETHAPHGAPISIWLGILLDAIPESLVIGAQVLSGHLSASLILGVFLSNYPEALSSSQGMLKMGFSFKKTLIMWTIVMLITGVGAAIGSVFFIGMPEGAFSFTEAIAAGAMLTVIADTILPLAYFKKPSIVGISTLAGFLCAILAKVIH